MAIAAAKLYVEVNADTKRATDDLAKLEAKVKAFERVGDAFTSAGKKMTMGLTLPIVAAGGVSIKMASDLSESMNKVDVVFGSAAESVQEFSKTAAESMGMSRQAALEATGTFGNLFVSMGLGIEQSADMSTGLVQLASDLASFNNIDPGIALEKLRAGLVGEVEPLRTLGVNLSAAAVQAKVLEMGLAGTTEEITPAMQAQARYAIILEQTKSAQGDFARTSDGLANSTRTVKAEIEDLATEFGQEMLPFAKSAVDTIRDMIDAFSDMTPETKKVITALVGIVAIGGPALMIIGKVITGFIGLTTAAKTAAIWLAASGGPITLIIGGVAALGTAIYLAIKQWNEWKKATEGTGRTAEQTMASLAGVSKELTDTTSKLHLNEAAWVRVETGAANAQKAIDETAAATEEAAQRMSDALSGAASAALQAGLSGTLTEANQAYALSMAGLVEEHDSLALSIQNLLDVGYTPASTRVAELTKKLGENEAAQATATEAMRLATAEMVYQQAAAGLDATASLGLARSMGLISEADYATATSLQNLRLAYDLNADGAITASEGAAQFAGSADLVYQAVKNLQEANLPVTMDSIKVAAEKLSEVDVSTTKLLPVIDDDALQIATTSIVTYKESTKTALGEVKTEAETTAIATKAAFDTTDWAGTGRQIGEKLRDGISGSPIKTYMKTLLAEIKLMWTDEPGWNGIGLFIITGIAQGVKNNTGMLADAMRAAIAAALLAAREAAKIHSPSKLFADMVGNPIAEGMAYGILQAAPLPAAAVQSVVNSTAASYDQRTINFYQTVGSNMDLAAVMDEIRYELNRG